jgi:hypothetical protein
VRNDAVTCSITDISGDMLDRITASPYGFALVLDSARVLLGQIRRTALEAATAADPIEPLIEPGPSTIRPHLTIDELRERLARSNVRTLIVTTPAGVLLGVVRREHVLHRIDNRPSKETR